MANMNKQLTKYYRKKLVNKAKKVADLDFIDLDLFATQIQLLRDKMILAADISNIENNMPVATITMAIAEYNAYKTEQDAEKGKQHLQLFWKLIYDNLQNWRLTTQC